MNDSQSTYPIEKQSMIDCSSTVSSEKNCASKKTKILLLCLDMDPEESQGDQHTGAAHLYVKETLEMLGEHDVECIAVTRLDDINKEKLKVRKTVSAQISLHRIQVGEINKQPKEYLWDKKNESKEKILDILKGQNFKPDIIHAIYWYSGDVALELLQNYPNAKLMYTIVSLGIIKHQWKYGGGRMMNNHDSFREKKEKEILSRADVIAAVSNQEKNNAINLYKVDANKIFSIGRGVDGNLFCPISQLRGTDSFPLIDENFKVLLFVGRIIKSKGYNFLLEVYDNLLKDPTLQPPSLWFVGGTQAEVEEAKKCIDKSPSLREAARIGKILWWGVLPRTILPILYQRALVTCVPSYYEPGARVILESMSCGTPVIMTPTGYSHELVRPSLCEDKEAYFENGYVAEIDDVKQWSVFIKSIIRDRVWHDTLSIRARLSVQPYFSLEQFADRHWKLYSYLINNELPVFPALDFSEAYTVAKGWTSPYENVQFDNSAIDDEIRKKITPGYKVDNNPNGGGSTKILDVCYDNKEYFYKQYIDKTFFCSRYFPFHFKTQMRYAYMRYNYSIERLQTVLSDSFFLPVICRGEGSYSLLYPYAETIPETDWDESLIKEAIGNIKLFHKNQSNKFNDYKAEVKNIILPQKVEWHDLFNIYLSLAKINSNFRNGGLWYTPVRLDIDLSLIKKGLEDNIWNLEDYEAKRLKRELGELESFISFVNNPININIIWSECRTEHFVRYNNELKAIDTETISMGEEEYDFACFFFWRTNVLKNLDVSIMLNDKSTIIRLFPNTYRRILSWIWVLCFNWYLRDYTRGNTRRLHSFRTIMSNMVK